MANEGKREWNIKLIDTRTKRFVNDDTGKFEVYEAGVANRIQINNASGVDVVQQELTGGTDFKSATMTDGTLRFWTARSVSAVDVSILTAGGRSYWLDNQVQSQHRVDVDPHSQNYVLVVAIDNRLSATNVAKKLGFQLQKGMVIHEVYVNVTSIFTGASALTNNIFNIGRSGQADAFLNGVFLTTTGLLIPVIASTTGLIVAVQKIGTELIDYSTGGAATTQEGWLARINYVAVAATATNNLTMNLTSTATIATSGTISAQTGKAYVYFAYSLLPMP